MAASKQSDLTALIELTKTTQALLTHYQASLSPSNNSTAISSSASTSTATSITLQDPLSVLRATTTLLKSHTTTLSLLLITPPLTPSAITTKLSFVGPNVLGGMVAAALYMPGPGKRDTVGQTMRIEVRGHVRRLIGTWGEFLALLQARAEKGGAGKKDEGPSEAEKQSVLGATGVVWDACDALIRLCEQGVVALVVKKAEEWRATLLDAVSELKEWGEDVDGDDEEDAEYSREDEDEDDLFGTEKKLGKDDTEMRAVLDKSVKKGKMIAMLFQAVVKRRLRTYPVQAAAAAAASASPSPSSSAATATVNGTHASTTPSAKLDALMATLKSIPDTVDDLASAFYDLDAEEAQSMLEKCCDGAKRVVSLVRQSWSSGDDEFTTWSEKWVVTLDAV